MVLVWSILYLAVAILVFRIGYCANENIRNSRHGRRHPDLASPTWVIAVGAILWPIQIIGVLAYIIRGDS